MSYDTVSLAALYVYFEGAVELGKGDRSES